MAGFIDKLHAARVATQGCKPVAAFRAFCSRPRARGFVGFLYSPYYIYAVGLFTLVFNLIGVDEITYTVLGLVTAAAFVFCPDALPGFVSATFCTIARSVGNRGGVRDKACTEFTSASYALLAVVGAIVAICFVINLLVNFKPERLRGGRLYIGYAALAATLLINGAFSDGYDFYEMYKGFRLAVYLVGIYLFVRLSVSPRRDTLRYLSYMCLVYGLVVGAQLCACYFNNGAFIESGYAKDSLYLGWGISNTIGEALFRCMPLCFYLMCTEEKHNWYYFTAATLILTAIVFTYARASLIFAAALYVVCYALCCVFGKNRKQILLCGLVFIAVAGVVVMGVWRKLSNLLGFFIENGMDDRGRFEIWAEGIKSFFKFPFFGAGLSHCRILNGQTFYHNTFVQFLASGGAVGTAAYLFHRMQVASLFMQRPTPARAFIGVLVGGILLISLLDNFYLYRTTQSFMAWALLMAEHDLYYASPFAYGRGPKRGKYKRLFF